MDDVPTQFVKPRQHQLINCVRMCYAVNQKHASPLEIVYDTDSEIHGIHFPLTPSLPVISLKSRQYIFFTERSVDGRSSNYKQPDRPLRAAELCRRYLVKGVLEAAG